MLSTPPTPRHHTRPHHTHSRTHPPTTQHHTTPLQGGVPRSLTLHAGRAHLRALHAAPSLPAAGRGTGMPTSPPTLRCRGRCSRWPWRQSGSAAWAWWGPHRIFWTSSPPSERGKGRRVFAFLFFLLKQQGLGGVPRRIFWVSLPPSECAAGVGHFRRVPAFGNTHPSRTTHPSQAARPPCRLSEALGHPLFNPYYSLTHSLPHVHPPPHPPPPAGCRRPWNTPSPTGCSLCWARRAA